MLPYAPLHHLLLADCGGPLVLTSGNVADEPIAYRDADALARLRGIADLFLVHDRPIHVRADDSVVRAVAGRPRAAGCARSRGACPASLRLPVPAARAVLACGAELKSTFCVARGGRAWVGHHIGDLRERRDAARVRGGRSRTSRRCSRSRRRSSPTTCTPTTSRPRTRSRARASSTSPSSTTTRTSRPASPSTARPARRSARSSTAAATGRTGRCGAASCSSAASTASSAPGTCTRCACRAAIGPSAQPWRMACAWLVAAGEARERRRDPAGARGRGRRRALARGRLARARRRRRAGHDERRAACSTRSPPCAGCARP